MIGVCAFSLCPSKICIGDVLFSFQYKKSGCLAGNQKVVKTQIWLIWQLYGFLTEYPPINEVTT